MRFSSIDTSKAAVDAIEILLDTVPSCNRSSLEIGQIRVTIVFPVVGEVIGDLCRFSNILI